MASSTLQEIDLATPGQRPVPPPRSARLPRFLGRATDPGPVLDALDVTVVGVGSVGRNMALDLARQQIGTLRLIDRGHYKPESLLTQPITPADVGEPKAGSTGRLCKQLSPGTRVLTLDGPVADLDASELADTNLVLLATDNLAAEVEVGQCCLHLGKPLVQASVHGDTLVAQVRFFANHGGAGPCPACSFGAIEWAHLNQETTFSCEGLAAGRTIAQTTAVPTMSAGFLCALAANLALVQAFRHVLQLGPAVNDALVEYCGYTNRTVTAPLSRNPECPCDHTAWTIVPAPRPLPDCTLGELAGASGVMDGAFTVDDLAFAEKGVCARCGEKPVLRFVAAGQAARCPTCNGPLVAQPFYTHRPVPIPLVSPIYDLPLRRIGAASPRSVVVRGADCAVMYRRTTGEWRNLP